MESTKYRVPDVLGQALLDYQENRYTEDIITYSSLDETDILSLPYLFRSYNEMPAIERAALDLCRGKILDIGCGAGPHTIYLQRKGFQVTALDSSPGAIRACSLRGANDVSCMQIIDFKGKTFDTLLLLMNGIGLAKQISRLPFFLNHLKTLLNADGQILLDSSDIIYIFEDHISGGYTIPGDRPYYGEVTFQMEYKGKRGETFDWLYLDFFSLQAAAHKNRLGCELLMEGGHHDYLAKLSL